MCVCVCVCACAGVCVWVCVWVGVCTCARVYMLSGEDLILWLARRLDMPDEDARHLAILLCQYGYIFPVSDTKVLTVKDDNSLYRFQVIALRLYVVHSVLVVMFAVFRMTLNSCFPSLE